MFHFSGFRFHTLCIQLWITRHYPSWVPPFGNPRIKAIFQLPEAYRRYTRPSSPVDTKASTSGPYPFNYKRFCRLPNLTLIIADQHLLSSHFAETLKVPPIFFYRRI
jgi:hypothetical protein